MQLGATRLADLCMELYHTNTCCSARSNIFGSDDVPAFSVCSLACCGCEEGRLQGVEMLGLHIAECSPGRCYDTSWSWYAAR